MEEIHSIVTIRNDRDQSLLHTIDSAENIKALLCLYHAKFSLSRGCGGDLAWVDEPNDKGETPLMEVILSNSLVLSDRIDYCCAMLFPSLATTLRTTTEQVKQVVKEEEDLRDSDDETVDGDDDDCLQDTEKWIIGGVDPNIGCPKNVSLVGFGGPMYDL